MSVAWMQSQQPGQHGHQEVAPVRQGRRRGGVDEDVAQEAAAQAGGAGEHQDAEHVELPPYRDEGPGDGEDEE